jgi:hypothetical protein
MGWVGIYKLNEKPGDNFGPDLSQPAEGLLTAN